MNFATPQLHRLRSKIWCYYTPKCQTAFSLPAVWNQSLSTFWKGMIIKNKPNYNRWVKSIHPGGKSYLPSKTDMLEKNHLISNYWPIDHCLIAAAWETKISIFSCCCWKLGSIDGKKECYTIYTGTTGQQSGKGGTKFPILSQQARTDRDLQHGSESLSESLAVFLVGRCWELEEQWLTVFEVSKNKGFINFKLSSSKKWN